MKRVSVDVVTVCLNSSRTIIKCLESVRMSRELINRFIVIDGQSTDGTLELLAQHRDIVSILISEKDNGISDAFNKGIALCEADFVLILNADDWLIEGALKKVLSTVTLNDEVVSPIMISCMGDRVVGEFRSSPERIPQYNSMLHPGTLVRKDLYDVLGVYDLGLCVGMDYDFFCRCYKNGCSIRVVELPLVCFSEGGVSRKLKYQVFKESFRLRKKYFNAMFPFYELKQLVSRFFGDFLDALGLKMFIKRILS